jgi:signal transduction histidine kinase
MRFFQRGAPPKNPSISADASPTQRFEHVLDILPIGVVVLDASLKPLYTNATARGLLRLAPSTLPDAVESGEILSIARRALAEGSSIEGGVVRWPGLRRVRARAHPIGDEAVVFLQDVTEEALAQKTRKQFVVNASHELKTPVAGLHALAEAVEQAVEDSSSDATRLARKLGAETERLGQLINDLLDLSRLEDSFHFSRERIDLATVTEQEVRNFVDAAEAASVTLSVDVANDAYVRGDRQQLRLLVKNLVDNAIRYSEANGRVGVSVRHSDSDVILEVEDNGTGIPLQVQSRVFERFFRVAEDRARNTGGTGLGLSIVKHVVEMHGGHIRVSSEPGEGSTFTVSLPGATA